MKKYSGAIILSFLININVNFIAYSQNPLFPTLQGWELSPDFLQFTNSDLFSYIDGAADNFISYKFEKLVVGEYRKGNQVIKSEIYCHGDENNGFGIYSSERFPDYNFIDIGGQAYTSDNVLNMNCGRYYVKLFAETKSSEENQTMIKLAHLISEQLDKNASLPLMLKFFPPENKTQNAEQFINQGFLGYEFLDNAFTADYSIQGNKFKLFIITSENPQSAMEVLEHFLSYNNLIEEVRPGNLIVIDDKYNGSIPVILKGKYIIGCLNQDNGNISSRYLYELEGNLK